jgi:hypothetical protein
LLQGGESAFCDPDAAVNGAYNQAWKYEKTWQGKDSQSWGLRNKKKTKKLSNVQSSPA